MVEKINQIFIIFIFGLFLQVLLPMDRVFNFDQDQVAFNSVRIASGDLTALGPQTSNMIFFTGPLIYYLAAPWFALTGGHPLASAFTASFIFMINFWLIYWIFSQLFKKPMVKIFLAIFALSPFLVQFNRITWNPLFSFLAGSLVLAGLLKKNYRSVLLGMFFGYQASFSGFVLLAALGLYGLWQKRDWRLVLTGCLGFLASILPLIYFDLRHGWLNLNGLAAFATQISAGPPQAWWENSFLVLRISLENFSKLIFGYFFPELVLVIVGLAILLYWLKLARSNFTPIEKKILIYWLVIFPAAALFYTDGLPEYYFLMQLPAAGFILSDIFLGQKKNLALVYSFMVLVSVGVIFDQAGGYNLKDKFLAMQFIHEKLAGRAVELHFDMDYKEQFGWGYLQEYFNIETISQGPRAHLIYPINSATNFTQSFGKIGVYLNF